MAFVGFDVPRLRRLAADLRSTAAGAMRLHRDIAHVLSEAEEALAGKPATTSPDLERTRASVLGIPAGLPGTLDGSLQEMAGSVERRCAQLEACEKLASSGLHVDGSLVFLDEPPPDPHKVSAAMDALKGLKDADFGVNGNRDDLVRVARQLTGLTAAETDLFLDQVPDEDLKRYASLATGTDDSFWNPFDANGLPLASRVDLASALLGKVSPAHQQKLLTAFPWTQPGFDTTDIYLDGRNSQSGNTANGMHYGVPADPVFADGVSAADISQGSFGDCWYIASLTATAQVNPDFIREGIRENPNGTVSVRVWDADGHQHWVTVTRDLPLDEKGGVVGAHGTGETWPAYYEKAFAALYSQDEGGAPDDHEDDHRYDRTEQGDYGAIEWDYTDRAPRYVTGHKPHGLDMDYDDVKQAFDSGHPVIVASNDSFENVPDNLRVAYVTRHVYYVKGFHDGKVILGNPWGSTSPTVEVTPDQFEEIFNSPQALDVGG